MAQNEWFWFFQFLGRLHPLAVHFPIGLLIVALFFEVLTIGGKRKGLREGIVWLVYLGAFSALLSTLLGWLLRNADDYGGELVQFHQNIGIATAVLSVLAAFLLRKAQQQNFQNFLAYRSTLIVTVISLTITGHLGANLTHGEDFLTSTFPGNHDEYDSSKSGELLAELTSHQDSISSVQLDKLNLEVRAIFAHNCYQCHSEEKQKGDLMLDSEEGVFRGGESGPVLIAGNAEESEIIHRITLPPDHDDVMPKKGKILKPEEIALIRLWIDEGAHWAEGEVKVFPEAPLALSKPSLPPTAAGLQHPVDRIINAYFEENDIEWPEVVDDRLFIRRVYLDIVGLLPEPEAIDAFVNNPAPEKRNALIRKLLNDDQNYTQHWLSFWNDLLRNDYSGTGFITGGRKQITDWLYQALLENMSYDEMVKELVNPTEASEGFIRGIEWRGVVNASQTTEMQAAQNIGQSLLGLNLKCASCHNSFVSNITLAQAYGFANVFADSTLELYRCDKPTGKMAKVQFIYPELGAIEADSIKDRLRLLSETMVKPENGRLYRTITNRIWERLMGRGIVEPLDEMDNTPWNGMLLDWLAADFIDHDADLKYLMETIMTSKTYQLPTVNYDKIDEIKSEKYVFAGPVIRRLSAEQFSDAVSQVIAPVYYAAAFDPSVEELNAARIWHREIEFDRDVLPKPGDRYFRYKFNVANKEVHSANILISVDHAYKLYINGSQVAEGSDWRKVDKLDVKNVLKSGKNVIAIAGVNEGNIPNPAGILFALKIKYADGSEDVVRSNKDWKSTDEEPSDDWIDIEYDDSGWEVVRDYGNKQWGKLVDFTFQDTVGHHFARAALVQQDPFMKALGRPTRENVTTSRDDQATLLQALELTNGEFFNDVIHEGAESWLQEYGANSEKIAMNLYQKSLGRNPSDKEKDVILDALGENPDEEAVQDLFWATLLLPEFQFIY